MWQRSIGADAKAETLAAEVDGKPTAAEALTAPIKQGKRILFILSIEDGKIWRRAAAPPADGII